MDNTSSLPVNFSNQNKCKYCNVIPFQHRQSYNIHMRKFHPKEHKIEMEYHKAPCPKCGKICRKTGILLHLNNSCPNHPKKEKYIDKTLTQPVSVDELRPCFLCPFSSRSVPKFPSKDLQDRHVAICHPETLFTPLFQNQEINMNKTQFKKICEDCLKREVEIVFRFNKCPYCLSKVLNTVGYRKGVTYKYHLVNCHLEDLVKKMKEENKPYFGEVKEVNIPSKDDVHELDQDVKLECIVGSDE